MKKKTNKATSLDIEKWDDFFCDQLTLLVDLKYPWLEDLLKYDLDALDWGDCFIALEKRHRAKAEKAIRKFAKTKKWPPMSPTIGGLVMERCFCAAELIDLIQLFSKDLQMGAPERRLSDEKLLLWLLIETWNNHSREALRARLATSPYPLDPPAPPNMMKIAEFGRN